jgi:ankyrin repeat protein
MTPSNPDEALAGEKKITRDDIEAKFRELTSDVDDRADAARNTAMTVAAVAGAVLIVGVFLYGRRRGRKRTTVIEVRRF